MPKPNYFLVTIGTNRSKNFRRIRWRTIKRKHKFPFLLTNFFMLFSIIQILALHDETPTLISNFFTLLTILSLANQPQ